MEDIMRNEFLKASVLSLGLLVGSFTGNAQTPYPDRPSKSAQDINPAQLLIMNMSTGLNIITEYKKSSTYNGKNFTNFENLKNDPSFVSFLKKQAHGDTFKELLEHPKTNQFLQNYFPLFWEDDSPLIESISQYYGIKETNLSFGILIDKYLNDDTSLGFNYRELSETLEKQAGDKQFWAFNDNAHSNIVHNNFFCNEQMIRNFLQKTV